MRHLRVHAPGLLTTVQDAGRWGFQASGVPVGGAMDTASHRVANALVGNDADAATLEITLVGPTLEALDPMRVAVTGAAMTVRVADHVRSTPFRVDVPRGARIAFGDRGEGARAYLAVDGGIAVAAVLGSRATDLRSGFGGFGGRPLKVGDLLPVGDAAARAGPSGTAPIARRPVDGIARLRVLPGPHAGRCEALFTALCERRYVVSPRSDRMGYRLEGMAVDEPPPGDILSMPTATGTVQVLPDGTPILLMVDRQTTGGYAQVAVVITADVPLAGQLSPGDVVRFDACSREAAVQALIAFEQQMLAFEARP